MLPDLQAKDAEELQTLLMQWGQKAPGRLARRGKQAELERWIVNRWLTARLNSGDLEYPVRIWRGENPDFSIDVGPETIGLELTEGVDQEEQIEWTNNAKDDRKNGLSTPRIIGSRRTSSKSYPQMVQLAVEKKALKCSSACTHLLVYLNTNDNFFDDLSVQRERIATAIKDQRRFTGVWVKSGEDLMYIPMAGVADFSDFDRASAAPRAVEF